jgi:hypothetical protein
VIAAEGREQYDDIVKVLLSDPQVLAWILRGTTTEFSAMSVADIIPCIDEPSVSKVAVNPGLTNGNQSFITGLPQESKIKNEGICYYDVRFFARNPLRTEKDVSGKYRLIIDLEAQRKEEPGYDIVTRGIFYGGRMLSEQAGRNFKNSDYNALEKVYSIWLVFDCSEETANTISRYEIKPESVHGNCSDGERYDLLQVATVKLPKEGKLNSVNNKPSELHEMLYNLFVSKDNADEKMKLLREKFGIILEKKKGVIDTMCNLSLGLIEQGIEQGVERGKDCVYDILNRLADGETKEELLADGINAGDIKKAELFLEGFEKKKKES